MSILRESLLLLYTPMSDCLFPSQQLTSCLCPNTSGPIDLSDLHFKNGRDYDRNGIVAYAQAKKANILCARSLADQLKVQTTPLILPLTLVVSIKLKPFVPCLIVYVPF